jgi:hypothetical protein
VRGDESRRLIPVTRNFAGDCPETGADSAIPSYDDLVMSMSKMLSIGAVSSSAVVERDVIYFRQYRRQRLCD